MENCDSVYSIFCKVEKYAPRAQVRAIINFAFFRFFSRIKWWAHVIENPDLTKIIVFRRGTLIGLKDSTVLGGHDCPTSMLGLVPAWKYAQKNLEKNRTSDEINSSILIFIPFTTISRWDPSLLASIIVLFHHIDAMEVIKIKLPSIAILLAFFVIKEIVVKTNACDCREDRIGHGLIVTIWNRLNLFIIYDVSFWYSSKSVISTYAWIRATPTSSMIRVAINNIDSRVLLIVLNE